MSRKTAVMDASSAIILYKAGLHHLLTEMYRVVLPHSVYYEITGNEYAGADEYERMVAEQKMIVKEIPADSHVHRIRALDRGEEDTIRLYLAGEGQFVITDDGRAARYCRTAGIPFINALLVPVVLRFTGRKSEDWCRKAMDRVVNAGRYSKEVLFFAGSCSREQVRFAVP